MACTARSGCAPAAVSCDSITASVPSITALATSSTSARVGIGASTIDCSICVAVITARLQAQRLADDLLLQAGQLGIADLHAQVAARDHHHVRGLDDLAQHGDRVGALDLGHQRGLAAGLAQQAPRLVHVLGGAHERHRQEVGADLGRQLDVGLVLVRQRVHAEPAALAVQALAVGQAAAGP